MTSAGAEGAGRAEAFTVAIVGFADLDASWAALLARRCAFWMTFLALRGRCPLTTRARRLREASRADTRASAFLEETEGGRFSAFELFLMRKRLPMGWTMVDMLMLTIPGLGGVMRRWRGLRNMQKRGVLGLGRRTEGGLYGGWAVEQETGHRYVTRLQNCLLGHRRRRRVFGTVGVPLAAPSSPGSFLWAYPPSASLSPQF